MALKKDHYNPHLTEEEYLKTELTSDVKREYIDGQIYAMAGAGYNHNCISGNVFRKFGNHLEGKPCTTFMADMKVRLGKDYVYPDVVVDCSKMAGNDYFSTSPVIIVEVLSRSTRKTDATLKLLRYINLPSLQEYVMIESDIVSVQVLRKSKHWRTEYYFLDDSVTFESIELTLTVEEIYDRVDNTDINEFREEKQGTAEF
jgi:Uma2 family endonuclease